MSRYPSKDQQYTSSLYDLPVIDWSAVGAEAPTRIPFTEKGTYTTLPKADIVVITWTSAEWNALDHVFLHSSYKRSPSDDKWRMDWREHSSSASTPTIFGYFAMLEIATKSGNKTVMVYKAECHLAHAPWYKGLMNMVDAILDQAQPKKLLSIGTGGGATLEDSLGDVVVTNAGHAQLILSENENAPCNNKTITGSWFPQMNQMNTIEEKLFIPLSKVLTSEEWAYLLKEFQKENSGTSAIELSELINEPLKAANISNPKALLKKDKALLTTDYYYISGPEGNDKYSMLEMDDTIVGYAAQQKKVEFLFVRNVSDTVVVGNAGGQELTKEQRKGWSSVIYSKCGFYTSFNGALTAWSAITGE